MELPINKNSHLTAKEREKESFPTRWLLDKNLINGNILDFGCGFGKDVEFLKNKELKIQGYDKHYFPEYPTTQFDTILCHYVLNVLLPEQQADVLMSISELLKPTGKAYFTVRRDLKYTGFRTHKIHKKQTFQTNVNLPFQSILKNDYCEIYKYQHYNQIQHDDKAIDCIFCKPDKKMTLVTELVSVYSIQDKFPVSEGHTLVLPKKHSENYFELSLREQIAIWLMVNRVKDILQKKYKPDGFNVGFNVSEAGGQTIFHTHIHVIPRYKNDVENPKGGVRNVIPEKADYTQKPKTQKKFKMKSHNTVLVALMNNKQDFLTAQTENWYRIPVKSAPKNLREGIVKYIAFYQTKVFGNDKYTVRWYGKVSQIKIVKRKDLFPEEPKNVKTNKEYYKIEFEKLQALENPIVSQKGRRITFIPTSKIKLFNAKEINDLFNDSILEDKLWEAFLKHDISAERQYFVATKSGNRFLDFAIFCKNGNINIECDGDTFHTIKKDVKQDKTRDNELVSIGWRVIRLTTQKIEEELENSMNLVKETINKYGGMKNDKKYIFFPKDSEGQRSLF